MILRQTLARYPVFVAAVKAIGVARGFWFDCSKPPRPPATGGLSASTPCPRISRHLVGHATITQIMDTYSHVMPGMSDVAATALEEALGWCPASTVLLPRVGEGLRRGRGDGTWGKVWRGLLALLDERENLDWGRVSLEGSFISAKKGTRGREDQARQGHQANAGCGRKRPAGRFRVGKRQ
jgi:hypothetical protein